MLKQKNVMFWEVCDGVYNMGHTIKCYIYQYKSTFFCLSHFSEGKIKTKFGHPFYVTFFWRVLYHSQLCIIFKHLTFKWKQYLLFHEIYLNVSHYLCRFNRRLGSVTGYYWITNVNTLTPFYDLKYLLVLLGFLYEFLTLFIV